MILFTLKMSQERCLNGGTAIFDGESPNYASSDHRLMRQIEMTNQNRDGVWIFLSRVHEVVDAVDLVAYRTQLSN